MLQYVYQLYVQVPFISLRYKVLKFCNMFLKLYVQVLLSSLRY